MQPRAGSLNTTVMRRRNASGGIIEREGGRTSRGVDTGEQVSQFRKNPLPRTVNQRRVVIDSKPTRGCEKGKQLAKSKTGRRRERESAKRDRCITDKSRAFES